MELMSNITQHDLVPKHSLLSPAEKDFILDKYRIRLSDLPRLKSTDPVARYMGFKMNDVVKIVRRSEACVKHCTYRVVTI